MAGHGYSNEFPAVLRSNAEWTIGKFVIVPISWQRLFEGMILS
jgi:hypothetical protein